MYSTTLLATEWSLTHFTLFICLWQPAASYPGPDFVNG
jgi:hypothetical protein